LQIVDKTVKKGKMEVENTEMNTAAAAAAGAKPKGKLAERLSGYDKFKEKSYENEDDAISDAIAYIDELSASTKESEEFKENFMRVIEENPMLAYLVNSIKETGNIQASLQSLFDNPEDMLLQEGDDGYDKVQELVNKRVEQALANDKIANEYKQKMASFPDTLNKWAEAKNIDEAEKINFAEFIGEFMTKLVTGDIKEDELNKLWDSYKYKSDVSELQEDLGISNANAEAKPDKQEPLLPIPQSTTPAASPKPETPQQRRTPLDEVFDNQYKNNNK
jgi:ElaB/YqjD/DUF883 family membrane-anchored ribosome-binding protein